MHLLSHSRIKISSVIKIRGNIIRKLKIYQQFHKIKQNSQKFQILIAKLLFHKILPCQRFSLQEIQVKLSRVVEIRQEIQTVQFQEVEIQQEEVIQDR